MSRGRRARTHRLRRHRGEGWLEVHLDPGRPAGEARPEEALAGPLLAALATGRVRLEGEGGAPVDVEALPLTDFHLVRDLAERAGVLAPGPEAPLSCLNCDAPIRPKRRGAPLEPLLDPPADVLAAERDAPAVRTLARPLTSLAALEMRVPTVAAARTLWRRLGDDVLTVDARLVRALGLRGIAQQRRWQRAPAALARWLERAPDEAYEVVLAGFDAIVYPPRLALPVVCGTCGARDDAPAPSTRELEIDPMAWERLFGAAEVTSSLPDMDAFAALARRFADEVFAARGVANLELLVEGGTPPVDDAGAPLLGSYLPIPGDEDDPRDRFQIAVYYRTFASEHEAGGFDVEAELRETLDHEVEHHLHHLSGHDPLDAEERREAREELVRTYGAGRVRAVEWLALTRELGGIARFFFWGLLAAGALLALAIAAGIVD
ncbi:MAG: hypothetical protein AAGH15_21415 [Myxococcota bacterium]